MAVIAPPKPDTDSEEWAEQQLEEPFTDWDVMNYNWGWMQTKLAHCAGLPVNVQWGLSLAREYHLPALAACSADEIKEALVLVAPYAKCEGKYKLDVSDSLRGNIAVVVTGQAIYVTLFTEMEARQKFKSEDSLEKRAKKVIKALALAIDTKKARWDEIRARPISDEAKFALLSRQ
jgi:hypothetical protein